MARRSEWGGVSREPCPVDGCRNRKKIGDAVCGPCFSIIPNDVREAWLAVKYDRGAWHLRKQAARNAMVNAAGDARAAGAVGAGE